MLENLKNLLRYIRSWDIRNKSHLLFPDIRKHWFNMDTVRHLQLNVKKQHLLWCNGRHEKCGPSSI